MSITLVLVHGANKLSPQIAADTGWEYGTRDDYTAQGRVYMFDWNWKKPATDKRWARYLHLIQQHRPYMAMAPDFETPAQWAALKRQVVDIRRAGAQRVIVTPKHAGALRRLPHWQTFIIGVSVPAITYASYLPEPATLAGRNIHLLGGDPDQWVYLRYVYERAGAHVVSADGNFAMEESRRGKYWSAKRGGYVEMRGEGFDTEALARATLRNVRWYMAAPPAPAELIGLPRVQLCAQALYAQQMELFTQEKLAS